MKKRLLSILLVCMLVMSLLPTAAFAASANSYDMVPQTLPLTLDATGEQVDGTALTYDESLTEYGLSYKLEVIMSPIKTMYDGLKQFIDTPTVTFSNYVTFSGGFKLTLTVAEDMVIATKYQSADDLKAMAEGAFSTSTGNFGELFSVGDASWSGKTATFTISFNDNITGESITAAGGIPDSITFNAPADMLTYPQTAYPEIGTLTAEAALTESSFVIGIPKDPNDTGSDYQTSLQNKVNAARNNPFFADIAKALFPTDATDPITGLNVPVQGSATNELTLDKPLSKVASPTVLPASTPKTTVTLTLPSLEKKKNADVVFVIDASDDKKINNIVLEAQAMVEELLNKNNVNAKVGIVQFSEHVGDVRPLTELTAESAIVVNADLTGVSEMVAAEMAANPYMSRGSNIQGALRNAKDMLASDTTVAAANKYIVLLTDGGPTFYENTSRDVMTMYVNPGGRVAQYDTRIGYQERYSIADVASYGAASVQALLTESTLANGTDLRGSELEEKLKNVGPDFGDDVSGKSGSDVPGAQKNWGGADPAPVFVTMLEKGFYHLCTEMLSITDAGYNIITVSWPYHAEKVGGEVHTKMAEGLMLWIEQYIGPRYVNDSAAAVQELSSLENTLCKALGSGTVTDVIADKFDLVIEGNECPFTLTVGGVAQAAAADGENKWNFGVANAEGVYPYSVSYTPGSDEQFAWEVNVPTEIGVPVKLSYDLLLTDTSASGTFPTNTSAKLEYKDSEGIKQTDKWFDVPEVTYEKSSNGGGGGGGGGTTNYTLTFDTNGGTAVPSITRSAGSAIQLTQTTAKSGYVFDGWYTDAALTNKVTSVTLNRNMTVYAKWSARDVPAMFREDHVAYIIGYKDGNVHPEANITRGEIATIFFRLMTDDARNSYWKTTNSFSDVNSDIWFNNAVSTMSNAGFISGYKDGTFGGYKPITRAEFAVIAARANGADGVYTGTDNLTDISGHWAQGYINDAVAMGLIAGYTDGTFMPNAYITRAEAMTIVNRFLARDKVNSTSLITDMIKWPDNMSTNAWYYYTVQEATNSHDFIRQSNDIETWTKLIAVPDWAALEKSWSTANSAK